MSDGIDDLSRLQDIRHSATSAGRMTDLGATMGRRRVLQTLSGSSLSMLRGASFQQWLKSLKLSGVRASKPATTSIVADASLDLTSLKLDSSNIGAAIPFLKTLSREQRLALLPEARRQEGLRWQKSHSGSHLYSEYTEAHWMGIASSYMPSVLLDDPPWPTFFQHLRQYTRSVERCIKSGIAVPGESDWIYVGKFKEGVDESLRSPVRVWVARKCEAYFLRIDDGHVAEEKARHDFNLVRLIENLAPAGLDDLKLAVAGRREFSAIARIVDFRLKKTGEKS
jgi:hypothetical protein